MSQIIIGQPRPEPSEVDSLQFEPKGAILDLMALVIREVPPSAFVMSGGAGTGKTRCALEILYRCLQEYPGCRALIVRKARANLSETALATFENYVLPPDSEVLNGNQRSHRQNYKFNNGSMLVIGGMDTPTNILSGEYDIIFVNECTEISEADWSMLASRLRSFRMPFQLIFGDCNPSSPYHWIYQRYLEGKMHLVETTQEDNPKLWEDLDLADCELCNGSGLRGPDEPCMRHGRWRGEQARKYIQELDQFPGLMRDRLRFGRWVQAEGVVYKEWDAKVHVVTRQDIPYEWPRYWAIDWGYSNPFVCLLAAVDPTGTIWVYREFYMSERIVEDHAKQIRQVAVGELGHGATSLQRLAPRAIICDHDLEDRATFERHMRCTTTAAQKDIEMGIQCVRRRLISRRLKYMQGSLVELDQKLHFARRPTSLLDEITTYAYKPFDPNQPKNSKEEPVDKDNHACDALRYLVAFFDMHTVTARPAIISAGGVPTSGNPNSGPVGPGRPGGRLISAGGVFVPNPYSGR